jgi:hypothetical protein
VGHAAEPRHLQRGVGELLAVDQHHRPRVLADELQLGHCQSPVERQEDGAQPPAGELQLEDVGVVHAENRHPVAARDPESASEPQGGARDAVVERGIGEASAGGQIVRRFGARREARVMGDPVFRSDTRSHAFPFPFVRKLTCKYRRRQGRQYWQAKVEFLRGMVRRNSGLPVSPAI